MEIRLFEKSDFETYQQWYQDDELNSALGPLDDEWLQAVLNEQPRSQFVITDDGEMIGVIGIAVPESGEFRYVVTDVAVDPTRKRTGIGKATLELVVKHYELNQGEFWIAYVESSNQQAQAFFNSLGWRAIEGPDKHGMICFAR